MKERCIICNKELEVKDIYLCQNHTMELQEIRLNGELDSNIFVNPTFNEHCMICGEWKNREMILIQGSIYICNRCLDSALNEYNILGQ